MIQADKDGKTNLIKNYGVNEKDIKQNTTYAVVLLDTELTRRELLFKAHGMPITRMSHILQDLMCDKDCRIQSDYLINDWNC